MTIATANDIELELTCDACPEQYNAKYKGEPVGYLRLRHGFFYVECPDTGGQRVYEAHTEGDGLFDGGERDLHLNAAKAAIARWYNTRS